ncbi:probable transmembrane protein 19 [Rhynchosporium graminicola]|uniref:Probable transmembrane protein 19 n=1 Tax=Rhynchosporium graminicola TaxID=2792576 RepID=A0A1E1JUM6_9HELO|nr:probable transmembrane protein 19 [Rhynchosporium commune]
MKAYIAGPAILAVVTRAYFHKSLTPAGCIVAGLSAAAHAVHPWSLPFGLLLVFFLAGTRVTKVKHDVKAKLTMSASGKSGGEGARTHVQVLANSLVASVLTLLHAYQLYRRNEGVLPASKTDCYAWPGDLLVVGIVANYAAVAADTFSSELGILSKSKPRLITSWNLRQVPPGTNGGVTLHGLASGFLGSLIIVAASVALTPFCDSKLGGWGLNARNRFAFAMAIWGGLGSVLDSFLGGWLQQSVVDTRTGRVVEGDGGKKVLVSKGGPNSMHYKKRAEIRANLLHEGEGEDAVLSQDTTNTDVENELDEKMGGMDKYDASKKWRKSSFGDDKPSRIVESGSIGILDNNEVNFLMALTMSLGAMGVASWFWDVPFSSIFTV